MRASMTALRKMTNCMEPVAIAASEKSDVEREFQHRLSRTSSMLLGVVIGEKSRNEGPCAQDSIEASEYLRDFPALR